jgi:hypothetical protein
MAMLENTCPTTWNPTSGAVICMIAIEGLRIVAILNPDPRMKQSSDTNTNWMNVKVTGYRNWFMICLPMLLVTAEDKYHNRQISGSLEAVYNLISIPRVALASTLNPDACEVEKVPSMNGRLEGKDVLLLEEIVACAV